MKSQTEADAMTNEQQPADQCATCNGRGWIGGPSYREPDEGGVQCPDCNAIDQHAKPADQGRGVGDECSAISTGHKFGPFGPDKETQCEYCGESPAFPECSGTPNDCPENEGYGCCKQAATVSDDLTGRLSALLAVLAADGDEHGACPAIRAAIAALSQPKGGDYLVYQRRDAYGAWRDISPADYTSMDKGDRRVLYERRRAKEVIEQEDDYIVPKALYEEMLRALSGGQK